MSALDEIKARPRRAVVLIACMLVVVAAQATHWGWHIDDAAIVFAYARNLAAGEGMVPWPGGERIEAISDPTWLALLTLFQLMGLDGFATAQPLGMILGAATVPLVWRIARRALPDHDGDGALLAPAILALNPQFAIWSASGLENALFCFFLALAVYRTLVDLERGGVPWSALAYLGLAWTRPEGVLYAAVGGAAFLGGSLAAGRGLSPVGMWLGLFWIPSVILEGLRLAYFAWPLPNTFYAKVEARGAYPWSWTHRGWGQLLRYASRLWQGILLPVYVIALSGTTGRRVRIAVGVLGTVGVAMLWPGPEALQRTMLWPEADLPPEGFLQLRIAVLYGAGLALPLLTLGRPGGMARSLCWYSAFTGIFFSIYADGDWMGGFRWMSLFAPMAAVLLAVGWTLLADAVSRPWQTPSWLLVAVGVGLLIPPGLDQMRDHLVRNRDETPEIIASRSMYTQSIARKTFHDGPIVNLDMDMGGQLWGFPDTVAVDMAMLVDIPMARHWYQQRPFIEEYVFGERSPHFAHVHGWWASHSGFPTYPAWAEAYVPLPPYADVNPWPTHEGMWVRRDLIMQPRPTHAASHRVAFAGGVVLEDLQVPSRWWAPGTDGFLTAPVSAEAEATLVAFVSGPGGVVTWDLPMGYGLLPIPEWRRDETFRGHHAVPIPGHLPEGVYDLGFVVFDADGRVLPAGGYDGALPVPGPAIIGIPGNARVAVGEIRFPALVRIRSREALASRADQVHRESLTLAEHGDCGGAEARWRDAKRVRPRDWDWHETLRPATARAIAECWARRADRAPDPEAIAALVRAHGWDHRSDTLAEVGAPVARRLLREGHAARRAGDWDAAYHAFSTVLRFQPWRSWARRYAEEARDHRLGLLDDVRVGRGGAEGARPYGDR